MAFTLEYFEHRIRKEPDWVIPNLLKRGNTGFILGQPKKACKSWLMLNLAWDLSEAQPLWGIVHSKDGYVHPVFKKSRVVYFTQEDTEDDIDDRIKILRAAGRPINDRAIFVPKNLSMKLDTIPGRRLIMKELDDVRTKYGTIDLVMFDPMRRMHDGDENDSSSIAKLWGSLHEIHSRYACATLISHHITKPSDSRDETSPNAARGSGDIFGGGDAFINVVPNNQGNRDSNIKRLRLYFETKRTAPLTPVDLSINLLGGTLTFDGFEGPGRPAGRPRKDDNPFR